MGKNHVSRNLFCGMPNDKLQECYRNRRTSLIAGEAIGIWKDMKICLQKQKRVGMKKKHSELFKRWGFIWIYRRILNN